MTDPDDPTDEELTALEVELLAEELELEAEAKRYPKEPPHA